ncbi:MAG: hypothetical protein KBD23_04435 [Gammaproteobacteria bacterium]|nr:hypothetical protein [Gammaproteobacteria bacterium]MBP9729367.1 hypothetical protein [Gammaproteobacteria bacterium]
MSDLTEEPVAYKAEDLDVDETLRVLEQANADFKYWSRMPYWSLEEFIGLLLGKNPKMITWNVICDCVQYEDENITRLCIEYDQLRTLALRSSEAKELETWDSPARYLVWARIKGITIPQELEQQVRERQEDLIKFKTLEDDPNLVKIKEQARQIAAFTDHMRYLEQYVSDLLESQWDGFDKTAETYAEELAIAFEAHTAVSQAWHKGRSVKQQLMAWLKQHYPKLSQEATERIAKICNWQKEGGAPLTP